MEELCQSAGNIAGPFSFLRGAHTERKSRDHFGVSPAAALSLWEKLQPLLPSKTELRHMLWIVVSTISALNEIERGNRLVPHSENVFKASVDGTDCRIQEPTPFNRKWYSHKFRGPGLRYEVGVSIKTGPIVWIYGPFPCGLFPDLKIYRRRMKQSLLEGERVVADGGYKDPTCSSEHPDALAFNWSYVRARHEALNRRLKQFNVLSARFRHSLHLHGMCFKAIANITQIAIKSGEVIFNNSEDQT